MYSRQLTTNSVADTEVLRELVGRPLFFAIECCEVERVDGMAIEGDLLLFNHRVVAVWPHGPVVMRHREGEDLPVQFFFSSYQLEQLNDPSHSKRHAVRILPVGNVECCRSAFQLACEKGEVHVVRGHEERRVRQVSNEWPELAQLLLGECRSAESHGVVGSRARDIFQRDSIVPAFVDTFSEHLGLSAPRIAKCRADGTLDH
jgi:hypothetical protein